MSEHIDTSDGTWREVSPNEWANNTDQDSLRVVGTGGGLRHWLRQKPMPPLPTEPGYYLGEQQGLGPVVVELLASPGVSGRQWVDAGDRNYLDEDWVIALGTLVRLEPRAETAKAVLDRLTELLAPNSVVTSGIYRTLTDEFGVSS